MRTDIRFHGGGIRGGKLLLVFGSLLLLTSAANSMFEYRELGALERRIADTGNRTVHRHSSTADAPVAEKTAVADVVRQLNLPYDLVMKAIVPPLDHRIALLELGIGADQRGGLKLTGEAFDYKTMTKYVTWLQARSDLKSVLLLNHEIIPAVAGQPVHFQLEIKWNH